MNELEAFVDGSAHRLSNDPLSPDHNLPEELAYFAVYIPSKDFLLVESVNVSGFKQVGEASFLAENLAIKKAIELGSQLVNSDCIGAINKIESEGNESICLQFVKGHKPIKTASEKELIMRIPHNFAYRKICGVFSVTYSLPVRRDWIKTQTHD